MENTDIFDKLYSAFKSKNIHEFENILDSTDANARDFCMLLTVLEDTDQKFLRVILKHQHTTLSVDDGVYLLECVTDAEMLEMVFDRIPNKSEYDAYLLLRGVINPLRERPWMVSKALCLLSKEQHLDTKSLSDILARALTSDFVNVRYHLKNKESPITYINAFIEGGIDIGSLPTVLPDYLRWAHKIHPDVIDALLKHGIPKSAAYVSQYMKSERYRT